MQFKIFSIVISFIVAMSVPFSLRSQDTTEAEVNAKKYVQISFTNGYLRSTNHDFNNALKKEGFNGMSLDMINGSVALDFFFSRRWSVTCKGLYFLTSSRQKQPDNLESSIDGYGGEMLAGYSFIQRNSWRAYIFGGHGFYTTILRIYDPNYYAANQPLKDILNQPSRDHNLSLGITSFVDIGLGAEKMVDLKRKKLDCPQNVRYLLVGFKVGYYNGFDRKIIHPDMYSLRGLYANLTIGYGTKIRKVKWN